MPDLLLRDIPSALHVELKKAAERSGRSLSEEARLLITKGLSVRHAEQLNPSQTPWTKLRSLIASDWGNDSSVDAFLADAEEARRASPRMIEDFE